jgi:outer membrane protein OmpA-like peptidoglycan-associated protein
VAPKAAADDAPRVPLQPGRPGETRPTVHEPARYADVQQRIEQLSAQKKPCPVPYHLAKAQAWLNFSRDQFHERIWQAGIRDSTLEQARTIVEQLEAGREPSWDTPLVSDASKLREDLWKIAETVKKQLPNRLCCAQAEAAFCEVQLVWSGHIARNVGGWRAAAPHIRQAEDLCGQAERQFCPAPPAAPAVVPPEAAVQPAPAQPAKTQPQYERITLSSQALFKHNRSAPADLLPAGRAEIRALVERLREVSSVQRIVVTGHADITNSKGDPLYNQKLSAARAQTVAGLLSQGGVRIGPDDIRGMGDAEPVVACKAPAVNKRTGHADTRATQAWHTCLQPNRRVVIEVMGVH